MKVIKKGGKFGVLETKENIYNIEFNKKITKAKFNWMKKNLKDLKDVEKWILHSRHHTVKHLEEMLKKIKKGASFDKAHKEVKTK